MGNHSSSNSSSHLNASPADAPPAHASAVHSAAARSSAAPAQSRGGPEGSTHSSGAAASASGKKHARAAKHVTAAPASSSLSSHKRAAAADGPSAAAAAHGSTPSSEQSTDSASNASQSKKQRGESSSKERNGSTAAAAASSVGIDPLPAASRRPAASAAESASSRRDLQSQPEGSAEEHRIKHWRQQQLFADAQRLIRGVLSFAEAEVHRLNPDRAAQVRGRMHELTAAKAELRSIPMLPVADQTNQRVVKQAQIEELMEWLKSHSGFTADVLHTIDTARAVAERQPADIHSMESLGQLCSYVLDIANTCEPLSADQQEVFSSWLRRVDALFTRFCAAVPHMALTQWQSQVLLFAALRAGALQLIPVLMRGKTECGLVSWTISNDPFLTYFCHDLQSHVVSLQPYLRLFEFGMDPTRIKDGGNPLSALQLARNFVRAHPPAPQAFDAMAAMKAAVAEDGAADKSDPDNWSVLEAHAAHHRRPLTQAEEQRRENLHARFMHAFVPTWLAHSSKVRSLLLEAAPGRLIPPLVDVVSRYLDLEGVPPERSTPVDDAAEMD